VKGHDRRIRRPHLFPQTVEDLLLALLENVWQEGTRDQRRVPSQDRRFFRKYPRFAEPDRYDHAGPTVMKNPFICSGEKTSSAMVFSAVSFTGFFTDLPASENSWSLELINVDFTE
jgi:hypothetical protein